jgi:hypothetical protein
MGQWEERFPRAEVQTRLFQFAASSVMQNIFRRIYRACAFVHPESVAFGIVGKNLAISTPMQGSLDLPLGLILGEVFLQEVTKELKWHSVV